ncbi:MAG TPA: efflux RND transporter periplasmic adaptor subunit [Bacteroidota bacterium]|nr:efflux RND transporter periplasmic adaptor subunit [Bacteroidota bacterium]
MKSSLGSIVLLFVALVLVGCGNSPGNSPGPDRRPVVLVEVERARRMPILATVSATGTITAKNEVKIIAQTEGKINKLDVEEGDRVTAGQVVVQLDASILAAQRNEAEAQMRDAEANYERLKRLYESNLVSVQEFDQAKTRYEVAKARLEYQEAVLRYTTIRSPISGVVTFRGAREGDIAVPRTVLLTVSDPTNLVIEVNVSELEIPKIKLGDPVQVQVDAYPQSEFRGKVRRIFPVSDPLSRLVKVEVQLTDKDPRLLPGMFARAVLTTSRKDDAVVLSNDAIIASQDGRTFAFVVEDTVVRRRELKLGIRDGRQSEVLEGVRLGEAVVVVGQSTLNDNMVVRVTKERTYGEAPKIQAER